MRKYRNNFSGRRAPGFRFRFHIRAIAHRALFIPLRMKQLPAVQRLLNGENPCEVFNVPSISQAREAFNILRCRFDFPFWAATRFPIRHIDDADAITSLDLNESQHHVIDLFLKRFFKKLPARYIITKQAPRCGLTTCVQAYIIWLQTFSNPKNSNICGVSNSNIAHLKANICRFFNKQLVPLAKRKFQIIRHYAAAFFNSFRNPDALRGIDFGYVHLADMSKWKDPDGVRSSRAICAAISGILPDYRSFIALEGNFPSPKYNPSFFKEVAYTDNTPHPPFFLHYHSPFLSP